MRKSLLAHLTKFTSILHYFNIFFESGWGPPPMYKYNNILISMTTLWVQKKKFHLSVGEWSKEMEKRERERERSKNKERETEIDRKRERDSEREG